MEKTIILLLLLLLSEFDYSSFEQQKESFDDFLSKLLQI